MANIILYLLKQNQQLILTINYLLLFISKYIPLKQFIHDDSVSPKYQKFKVDQLPIIKKFEKQDHTFLLEYYLWKYDKPLKPVQIRKNSKRNVPENAICPVCGAPHQYLYDNNGGNGQFQCKVCGHTFINGKRVTAPLVLLCPHCGHTLSQVKERKSFNIHKCVNSKCSYYKQNLKKLPKDLPDPDNHKYKLHYIYREFTVDFISMDLNNFSKLRDYAKSFKFKKNNAHIMGLCLTYHVNLGLSLRQTANALQQVHNINISHTTVANYAKMAAKLIKPFVDNYDYKPSSTLVADETYIKIKGVKGYIWFIMDGISRSVLGYHVSDNRGTGACILAMRMAFKHFKQLPGDFRFIADGYSAYPLASQWFARENDVALEFDITQVIGLTNDDPVSEEFRKYKQIVERLNRTFKASYRVKCGHDNINDAMYSLSLWTAYYNFLRPHKIHSWKRPLNEVDMLSNADNMPGKWQLLMYLGQQVILNSQQDIA